MFFYQYGRLSSLWLLIPLIFGWSQIHATVRHEVVAGDTLSGISAQHLGSAHHWPLLHQRNMAHIPNVCVHAPDKHIDKSTCYPYTDSNNLNI